jgi:hypothetical protein
VHHRFSGFVVEAMEKPEEPITPLFVLYRETAASEKCETDVLQKVGGTGR